MSFIPARAQLSFQQPLLQFSVSQYVYLIIKLRFFIIVIIIVINYKCFLMLSASVLTVFFFSWFFDEQKV